MSYDKEERTEIDYSSRDERSVQADIVTTAIVVQGGDHGSLPT